MHRKFNIFGELPIFIYFFQMFSCFSNFYISEKCTERTIQGAVLVKMPNQSLVIFWRVLPVFLISAQQRPQRPWALCPVRPRS